MPSVCEPGGPAILLQFNDYALPIPVRAGLYAIALVYSFLGVAIIADIFMSSIESITSRRKRKVLKDGSHVTVYVWNDTVANLSLMALGSSAPEIFLSLIDLWRSDMHASELGSSTIVGSAAFNLLVIVPVCIVCVPSTEVRVIEQFPVFGITAVFSLFAYLWIAFVLVVWTPDRIEIWEAVATFLFLPILVYVSYRADSWDFDVDKFLNARRAEQTMTPEIRAKTSDIQVKEIRARASDARTKTSETRVNQNNEASETVPRTLTSPSPSASESTEREREIPTKVATHFSKASFSRSFSNVSVPDSRGSNDAHGGSSVRSRGSKSKNDSPTPISASSLSIDDLLAVAPRFQRRKSIAAHHGAAMQSLRKGATAAQNIGSFRRNSLASLGICDSGIFFSTADVEILVDQTSILACASQKTLKLVRRGNITATLAVHYNVFRCKTRVDLRDHVLLSAHDLCYKARAAPTDINWINEIDKELAHTGMATIEEGLGEASFVVRVPPPTNEFCGDVIVKITEATVLSHLEGPMVNARVGRLDATYITRLVDTSPGQFAFHTQVAEVAVAEHQEKQVEIFVQRRLGAQKRVFLDYATEDLTAVRNWDYLPAQGMLIFEEGVTELPIQLTICSKPAEQVPRQFLVTLSSGGGPDAPNAAFCHDEDGGSAGAIACITVRPQIQRKCLNQHLDRAFNIRHLSEALEDWKENAVSALLCNGSWEAQSKASAQDWFFHIFSLPWNVLFVMVPPCRLFGGWACFFACLGFIGGVTGIIADLAELFGCVCDVPNIVTAITFVALGTSMPDLFASKVAATEDDTADASIVNVTGSNSVNVFLGLGLPWSLAAFYWEFQVWTPEWASRYPDIAEKYDTENCFFAVPAGNLGFSVVCFCIACLGAIALIMWRRRTVGGELGGEFVIKTISASALIFSWIAYICIVSWRALRYGRASTYEQVAVVLLAFFLGLLPLLVVMCMGSCLVRRREESPPAVVPTDSGGDDDESTVYSPPCECTPIEVLPPVPIEPKAGSTKISEPSITPTELVVRNGVN